LAIKADYQKQLKNLVEPDKTTYIKEKQKIEQKFSILKKEIEQKIVEANKSLNLEISKLPKSTTSNLKNPEIRSFFEDLLLLSNSGPIETLPKETIQRLFESSTDHIGSSNRNHINKSSPDQKNKIID
jgi:hypothetical protein